MTVKLHHPEVMRLRNRYHMARGHKAWATIKALASSDDEAKQAKAANLAKWVVGSTPRLRALQAGSRVARDKKHEFLRIQATAEDSIRNELEAGADVIVKSLTRAAGADGKIPPGRLRALFEVAKTANRTAYAGVNREFMKILKGAARGGLKAAMAIAAAIKSDLQTSREKRAKKAAESDASNGGCHGVTVQPIGHPLDEVSNPLDSKTTVPGFKALVEGVQPIGHLSNPLDSLNYNNLSNPLDKVSNPLDSQLAPYKVLKERVKKEREGAARALEILSEEDNGENDGPDLLRQKVEYAVRSGVFEKIFTGALRQTMAAGLFGETGVSNKVWDLRDGNLLVLKRILSSGIAEGRSAGSIAGDIMNLLVQPAGFDKSYGGPGVYRSAWKNAMRVARTESNRAYGSANALYAAEKEWNVVWHVSDGQREEDECDALDGVEMTHDEFLSKYPQHPQCLCYSTFAFPDFENEDSEVDVTPPDDLS